MLHFDKEEKVIREARRHWFVILAQGFFIFLLAVVPAIILLAIDFLYPSIFSFNLPGDPFYLVSFFYFLWLLFLWVALFIRWTDYYLDVWYITDKKIIDIEQRGLFNREVITLRHEMIQDITIETRGIIATIFKFGDIHVQTAGEKREIVLATAENPEALKRLILSQQSHHREKPRPVKMAE